jgi:hypothetical protein
LITAAEDGGMLGVYNTDGNLSALLTASEDGGSMVLYNRYGNPGWSESGKQ